MKQALGLVEIRGLSTAVLAADSMVKAANIRILEIENSRGLGYMTIKVTGDVGAVNAAVNVGRQVGSENQKLVSWRVIPRPSDYVESTFCKPEPPKSPGTPGPLKETEQEKTPDAEVKTIEGPVETAEGGDTTAAAEAAEGGEPAKTAETPEPAEAAKSTGEPKEPAKPPLKKESDSSKRSTASRRADSTKKKDQ